MFARDRYFQTSSDETSVMTLIAVVIAVIITADVETAASAEFEATIRLTKLDSAVTHYATFQSHNQKVVANQHGIFTTHIRDRDLPYQAQTWRLSRSVDGGQTFATLFEQTDATNPPAIETDQAGNIYLIRVDFRDGNAYLYRFDSAKAFRDPTVTPIPGAAAGKYAMTLDARTESIFFFAHNNSFNRLQLDGKIDHSVTLLKAGRHAVLQYPLLATDDSGQLHAGWTTQKKGLYLYWDIHHMMSTDQGDTWQDLQGRSIPIPAAADDSGPAERISADDEFESHSWLSSMCVSGGKAHFAYMAQTDPPREHYLRYDLASGKPDVHLHPEFRGAEISVLGLSGFFVTEPKSPGAIYFVGNDAGRIACLRSLDNGRTWNDYARTDDVYAAYAIGGYRLTHDGKIVGTFTQQRASDDVLDFQSDVYFFLIEPNPTK